MREAGIDPLTPPSQEENEASTPKARNQGIRARKPGAHRPTLTGLLQLKAVYLSFHNPQLPAESGALAPPGRKNKMF